MKTKKTAAAEKPGLQPYVFLVIAAAVMILASLLPINRIVHVKVGNTFYLFPSGSIYTVCGLYLLLFWVIYLLVNKYLLSVKLTWAHVVASILPVLVFALISLVNLTSKGQPMHYSLDQFKKLYIGFDLYTLFLAAVIVLVAGLVIFMVNLIGGLIKGAPKS